MTAFKFHLVHRNESICIVHTAHVPVEPSSRRGHSFQLIDNFVYMFGGRTDGYSCASVWRDILNLGMQVRVPPFCKLTKIFSLYFKFKLYRHFDRCIIHLSMCHIPVGGRRVVEMGSHDIYMDLREFDHSCASGS